MTHLHENRENHKTIQERLCQAQKSGRKNIEKLNKVMEKLIDGERLEEIHRDHPLQGEWQDFRDCHVESDWVLIYKLDQDINGNETITFCATDNHSNLFD